MSDVTITAEQWTSDIGPWVIQNLSSETEIVRGKVQAPKMLSASERLAIANGQLPMNARFHMVDMVDIIFKTDEDALLYKLKWSLPT